MSTPLPDDLSADWPADPDNDPLLQFAARFHAGLPEMSPAAQQKVHQAVKRELASSAGAGPAARKNGRLARAVLAAGIVIGAGVAGSLLFWPRSRTEPPAPLAQAKDPPNAPPVVDHYAVKAVPAPVSSDRALLQIDDNASLFTD